MESTFFTYHPLVNFSYFAFVLGFSMVFMHPACLAISLGSAFVYSIYLKGKKAVKFNLAFILPSMVLMALVNPVFNHQGITILTYLPGGNPLTLESIVYGLAAATMLASVVSWFISYNEIMTSDKFVYLFGRLIPALSLVLSMALRFIPKFKDQFKKVANAQKSIGRDLKEGNLIEKTRKALTILSIMVSWALENAIETSDSMKSRGYGLPGRSFYSIYSMEKRDKKALLVIFLLGFYVLLGGILGGLKWQYFPSIKGGEISLYTKSLWLAYVSLCFIPIIIDKEEELAWKATQSKT